MNPLIYVISASFLFVFSSLFGISKKEKDAPYNAPTVMHYNYATPSYQPTAIDSTKKKAIPFNEIDNIPTTTKCETLEQPAEIKACVSKEFQRFVTANFNMNIAKKEGVTGINKIFTRFKIDTKGTITDIEAKGSHPALEAEAKRVLSLFPQMNPGEHKGKKATVSYSLPIVFQVDNSSDKQLDRVISSQIPVKDTTAMKETLSGFKNNTVEEGFYLITNIYKTKALFKKGIENLKKQQLDPKWFKNPKDSYIYVYLNKYDSLEEAKKMLLSEFEGAYKKDLYILKVD